MKKVPNYCKEMNLSLFNCRETEMSIVFFLNFNAETDFRPLEAICLDWYVGLKNFSQNLHWFAYSYLIWDLLAALNCPKRKNNSLKRALFFSKVLVLMVRDYNNQFFWAESNFKLPINKSLNSYVSFWIST